MKLHDLSRLQFCLFQLLAALACSSPLTCPAQPSGGPYGPIPQSYVVPRDAAHVYYVAPDGKAAAAGTSLVEPTTLESAIAKVVTGDAIILRGGTYRVGGLRLNQGITLQPYAGEQPAFKGTRVADNWTGQRNGLWSTAWTNLFPMKPQSWWRRDHEGRKTPPWIFNNDMVFVDGRPLKAVGWDGAVDTNSFYIDYDAGRVYIAVNPANRLIEITAFDGALTWITGQVHGKSTDRRGPVIRGLTFTQYAYRALEIEGTEPEKLADPATYGKDIVGTTLENVTISHCSRVAAYFRGDKFAMRHCLITDTSTEGIYLLASSDCLLEKNVFARNNVEEITGYFPSAVKIFNQCHRVTCRDNLVRDNPRSNGIWYDVGNVDGVFINNWVENCQDGFFFEISKGAICAGNVFVDCDKGVRVLNSSNVRVYHNTFVNTVASIERDGRSAVKDHFGWHPSTGPDVDQREGHVFQGNLLVADASVSEPLLRFEQALVLCGRLTRPQVNQFDDNVYVRGGGNTARTLLTWSPAGADPCTRTFATLDEFQKFQTAFEQRSQYYPGWYGSVVKSPELKRCELIQAFPKPIGEDSLPADVRQLLGWSKSDARTPGAYPLRP
jgi:hypothetical protein